MKPLKLAFSSCPNDTFMFHALVHGLGDADGDGRLGTAEAELSLGWDCGPLLVCRAGDTEVLSRPNLRIATPGRYTTGALLCTLAYPGMGEQTPMLFSEIEGAVARGDFDLGVLIHEGRFTYREKGLDLVRDLGAWWQQTSGCPIPLGGIAVRRSLGAEIAASVDRALHRSIQTETHRPVREPLLPRSGRRRPAGGRYLVSTL